MISFFIKTGDSETSELFTPYLWGPNGLSRFIDAQVNSTNYGSGLQLLLIKVYVEGRFEVYGPEHLQVGNYNKLRQETSVAFTIRQTNFRDVPDNERKKFLIKMVAQAIESVFLKHNKKIPDFSFERLKANLNTAIISYLSDNKK